MDGAMKFAKNGSTLYPAMPYPSYARVSDSDMQALYAYFMKGVEPVAQENKDSDVPVERHRSKIALAIGVFDVRVDVFMGNVGPQAELLFLPKKLPPVRSPE